MTTKYDPDQIAACQGWLDPDFAQGGVLTPAAPALGVAVTTISDRDATAPDYAFAAGTAPPYTETPLPGLDFDGATHELNNAFANIAGAWAVSCVATPDAVAGAGAILGDNAETQTVALSGTNFLIRVEDAGASWTPAWPTGNGVTLSFLLERMADDSLYLTINEGTRTEIAAAAAASGNTRFRRLGNGGSGFFNGRLHHLAIYDGDLDADDRSMINSHMVQVKAGTRGDILPAGGAQVAAVSDLIRRRRR